MREATAPQPPPRTLLGVAALDYPDQLVEVEAVTVTPLPRLHAHYAHDADKDVLLAFCL